MPRLTLFNSSMLLRIALILLVSLRQELPRAQEALEYQLDYKLPAQEQPVEFIFPLGISASFDGTLWIINSSAIVQHLKPDGSFIGQFYASGQKYSAADNLAAIATAVDGSLWVINQGLNKIMHFTADGQFISVIDLYKSDYSTHYPLTTLASIALAKDGNLWVVDAYSNRLIHLSATGKVLDSFSLKASNPSFAIANKVVVAPDASLWVVSRDGLRIDHHLPDGTWLGQLSDTAITGLAINPDGSLWVLADAKLKHLDANGKLIAQFGGGIGKQLGQFNNPNGIAVASNGSVWVADTRNNRLQELKSNGQFSIYSANAIHLSSPQIAKDHSLWVVDEQRRIQHFDAKGNFSGYLNNDAGECPTNRSYSNKTRKIALAPDNSFWLIDNNVFYNYFEHITTSYEDVCVQHVSPTGQLIKRFQLAFPTSYTAEQPRHQLTIAKDGSVWLLDRATNLIQHFSTDGVLIENSLLVKNKAIKSISIAPDASLWSLEDIWNLSQNLDPRYEVSNIVKHFQADGSVISAFDVSADNPSRFFYPSSLPHPQALAVAHDGSIWVMNDKMLVQHFSKEGRYIEQFEITDGIGTNNFGIARGYDGLVELAVGDDNSVWVNVANNRLWKFTPQKPSPIPAEFDSKTNVLMLRDVVVDGQHYHAILKSDSPNNTSPIFSLLTYKPVVNQYAEAARLDSTANTITLPRVSVDGKFYDVVLNDISAVWNSPKGTYYGVFSAKPK